MPEEERNGQGEPRIALAIYVLVAMIWFVPDRRIEDRIAE
jgi:hypothetical protein